MVVSRRILLFTGLALVLSPMSGLAQVECLSAARQERELAALAAQVKAGLPAGPMRDHLLRAHRNAAKDRAAAVLAARVYQDVSNAVPTAPFVHYAVPPMSDVPRLEDVYPFDGEAAETVRIVAARDEFEPGAFLVYPLADLGKVAFSLTSFKTAKGQTFPANRLDMKVVKVWCQNGNGWYSYFGDVGFKLCPELLLHDEDLVRVDAATLSNYARVTGPDGKVTEQWINPPRQFDRRFFDWIFGIDAFLSMQPGFRDARTLQPVRLEEGRFRCLFLTAQVAADTPAGTYRGGVRLADKDGKALGEIPVELTVLPFELPQPKAYLQPDRDYLVGAYTYCSVGDALNRNGGDLALARRQFAATLRDFREHNQVLHWMRANGTSDSIFTLRTMAEAGMRTDTIICFTEGMQARKEDPLEVREAAARRYAAYFDRFFGHRNVYIGYDDEPSSKRFESNRALHEPFQKYGLKFIIGNGQKIFEKGAYFMDWHGVARNPEDDRYVLPWIKVGYSYIGMGAQQHVGAENPAYNRRLYGLGAYLSGWNCTCNYAHHYGPYNDDSSPYKPMVFAYGSGDGVIDTLQWEGFREAIDDVRYATLMTTLGRRAAESEDLQTRYAGKIALQYLAGFKRDEESLDMCRLEMANHILRIRELLGEK